MGENKNQVKLRINTQIRTSQVRLIDENSQQLGILNTHEALNMAHERGYDLVEISPNASPPVCRLLDYGKYIFDEKKRLKEQQKTQRQAQINTKEIQISPVIQTGDLEVKIKNIQRILDDGDKVKITIKFSGRQLRHTELGKNIFDKVMVAIPNASIERQPVFEGKDLFLILTKSLKSL